MGGLDGRYESQYGKQSDRKHDMDEMERQCSCSLPGRSRAGVSGLRSLSNRVGIKLITTFGTESRQKPTNGPQAWLGWVDLLAKNSQHGLWVRAKASPTRRGVLSLGAMP